MVRFRHVLISGGIFFFILIETPCSKEPCRNSAKCINKLNDFSCQCTRGTSGDYCEGMNINQSLELG